MTLQQFFWKPQSFGFPYKPTFGETYKVISLQINFFCKVVLRLDLSLPGLSYAINPEPSPLAHCVQLYRGDHQTNQTRTLQLVSLRQNSNSIYEISHIIMYKIVIVKLLKFLNYNLKMHLNCWTNNWNNTQNCMTSMTGRDTSHWNDVDTIRMELIS